MRKRMHLVAIIASLMIIAELPTAAEAQVLRGRSAGCPAGRVIPVQDLRTGTDGRSCGLIGRLVTSGSASVFIPPLGEGVRITVASNAGESTLAVETSTAGVVTGAAETAGTVVSRPENPAALPRACSLTDQNPSHRKWFSTPAWRINEAAHPKNVSAAVFRDLMTQSANAIHIGANDCGIRFQPVVSLTFNGGTTWHSNINGAETRCAKNRDKHNVVDFGNLVGGNLALTCLRWTSRKGDDKLIEADLRMDNSKRTWVTSLRKCKGNRYDMLSVGVHEFGHFVGLGHVAERGRGDLTMSPVIDKCDASARTLGRGDLDALRANY